MKLHDCRSRICRSEFDESRRPLPVNMLPRALTSSSSAAASPAWRPPTSCRGAKVSFVLLERAPRAGGVILSEEVDGFTIDGGPDALLIQKPDGIQLCEELGLGRSAGADQARRVWRTSSAAGRLHALPAASVLGIPTRVGPFLRTGCSRGRAKCGWARSCSCRPRRDDGDESIGAFMTRRFGARGDATTSPSRCSPAFMPATSTGCRCARCFRGSCEAERRTAACSARSDAARTDARRSPTARFDRCPAA